MDDDRLLGEEDLEEEKEVVILSDGALDDDIKDPIEALVEEDEEEAEFA